MFSTRPSPRGLPLAIESVGSSSLEALLETAAVNSDFVSETLRVHGAMLFRGWEVNSVPEFQQSVRALSGGADMFGYAGGASPRSALDEKSGVYSSTDYPAEMTLSLHNELSYTDTYPRRLYFFCLTAPERGGETTLGDSRRILAQIDPHVLETFKARQISYIRTLSSEIGWGYSWQEAFETEDREVAEARCAEMGAAFEWSGDCLRVRQTRPATAVHPETGEEVWFNQADGFHPTALDAETYRTLLAIAGSEDRFRLNVSYGDGSPIELETLAHIRAVIRQETIPHRWRKGDILVLDNLLAAHGRRPFSGPRRIALAMTC